MWSDFYFQSLFWLLLDNQLEGQGQDESRKVFVSPPKDCNDWGCFEFYKDYRVCG